LWRVILLALHQEKIYKIKQNPGRFAYTSSGSAAAMTKTENHGRTTGLERM
jgi:hypothetical protein